MANTKYDFIQIPHTEEIPEKLRTRADALMTRVNQLSDDVHGVEDEIREQLEAVEREDIASLRVTAEAAAERLEDTRFEARVTHVVACRQAEEVLEELLAAAKLATQSIEQTLEAERIKAGDGLRQLGLGPEGRGKNENEAQKQFERAVDSCAPVAEQLTRLRETSNLIDAIRTTQVKHLPNIAEEAGRQLDELVGGMVGIQLREIVSQRQSLVG